jgi:hypothetical protein
VDDEARTLIKQAGQTRASVREGLRCACSTRGGRDPQDLARVEEAGARAALERSCREVDRNAEGMGRSDATRREKSGSV